MIPWYFILAAVIGIAIIVITVLTIKKLKSLFKKKKEKNKKNSKIFFGETDKMISFDSDEEIKTKSDDLRKEELSGKMTEEEWNNFVKESNFISVEYDVENDEFIDIGRYSVKKVDDQVQKQLYDNDGIIIIHA